MPWLSRRNSAASSGSPKAQFRQSNHQQLHKPRTVAFIPAQIDGLCGTSPSLNTQTPWQLFLASLRIMMLNIGCIPAMIRSLCSPRVLQHSLSATAGVRDVMIHIVLAVMQICMLVISVPIFMLFPGFTIAIWIGMCWAITAVFLWPLKGSRIVTTITTSREGRDSLREDYSDERWIFVNGMTCSHRTLKQHCARLSRTFGREITGVHNASNGLIVDVLEALLQRSLAIPTPCTIALTKQLREACLSSSVRKVILLGHGTGGLVISAALDRLHADLPIDVLSKLEIYTFGSAAAQLSNPALRVEGWDINSTSNGGNDSTSAAHGHDKYTRPNGSIASPVKAVLSTLGHRVEDRERVIPHIEHYALASDIFARCGILHAVKNNLDTRFCGRVFVIDDAKLSASQNQGYSTTRQNSHGGGFLFEEHYLDILFPETDRISPFDAMEQIVEVDVATAEKREFTAQGVVMPIKALDFNQSLMGMGSANLNSMIGNGGGMVGVRTPGHSPDVSPRSRKGSPGGSASGRSVSSGSDRRSSGGSFNGAGVGSLGGSGGGMSVAEKRRSWGSTTMGNDCVGRARAGAKECEGRTVRQLSRLWRFQRGARVVGEGVPFANGVGLNTAGVGGGGGHGIGVGMV